MKPVLLSIACGLSILGCPPSDDDDDGTGKAGSVDASVPTSREIIGHFNVKLIAPKPATDDAEASAGLTTVSGKVYGGPLPEKVIWEQGEERDGCALFTPRVPFCDPPCGGAVCVEDDECKPNPAVESVGVVHVEGVKTTSGATGFDIEPIAGSYVNGADVVLPYPAFSAGDTIRIAAAGGDLSPFEIEVSAIAPLALHEAALALAPDEPLALSWDKATTAGSRIQIKLDISHHGGSKGKIECDVEDAGAHEISAALISKLLDLGVAGFPTVIIARVAANTASAGPAGKVELAVSMTAERALSVPGVESCTADAQCADGKKCQTDLTCR